MRTLCVFLLTYPLVNCCNDKKIATYSNTGSLLKSNACKKKFCIGYTGRWHENIFRIQSNITWNSSYNVKKTFIGSMREMSIIFYCNGYIVLRDHSVELFFLPLFKTIYIGYNHETPVTKRRNKKNGGNEELLFQNLCKMKL